ncbi:MAG: hypothetical protein EBZ69_01300 [Alphaproteobacteria bacterium]|nr:hypothetical protein [Alphaproteobacteria bacterium]
MWITSENHIINIPRGITINGIQHPQTIFYLWSKGELASVGIRHYHPAYPAAGERVVSSTIEENDGEVYERITTEPIQQQPIEENV